ncbi:hypothetical protein GFS60_00410 [Rhodococcus sp. WAY2]|nr:hypothetical protein GFS60_00410 [Rhodococcus sp. WAY2]
MSDWAQEDQRPAPHAGAVVAPPNGSHADREKAAARSGWVRGARRDSEDTTVPGRRELATGRRIVRTPE